MAHATSTPVKGKSTAAPRKTARHTPAMPTPAMIHALFVALRTLGWRSGLEHAHGPRRRPPDPVPVDAGTPLPTAEQIEALFVTAWQWGWAPISHEEAAAIDDMSRLTIEGIEHFEAVAVCIRQNHPWEPSPAERYAGAYKVPHYSGCDLPPVSPATPREEALFAVLRHAGVHAATHRAPAPLRPPTLPAPDATLPRLSHAQRDAIDAFGRELGWAWLAPRYQNLVELLRCCNDRGRAILNDTLRALLRRHRLGN